MKCLMVRFFEELLRVQTKDVPEELGDADADVRMPHDDDASDGVPDEVQVQGRA